MAVQPPAHHEVCGTADCADKAGTVHWKYVWKFSHGNLILEVDCWLWTRNKNLTLTLTVNLYRLFKTFLFLFCSHAKWV